MPQSKGQMSRNGTRAPRSTGETTSKRRTPKVLLALAFGLAMRSPELREELKNADRASRGVGFSTPIAHDADEAFAREAQAKWAVELTGTDSWRPEEGDYDADGQRVSFDDVDAIDAAIDAGMDPVELTSEPTDSVEPDLFDEYAVAYDGPYSEMDWRAVAAEERAYPEGYYAQTEEISIEATAEMGLVDEKKFDLSSKKGSAQRCGGCGTRTTGGVACHDCRKPVRFTHRSASEHLTGGPATIGGGRTRRRAGMVRVRRGRHLTTWRDSVEGRCCRAGRQNRVADRTAWIEEIGRVYPLGSCFLDELFAEEEPDPVALKVAEELEAAQARKQSLENLVALLRYVGWSWWKTASTPAQQTWSAA